MARRPLAVREYTVPDPSRPWDVVGRDGVIFSAQITAELDAVKLMLAGNQPGDAAATLKYLAYLVKVALTQARQCRDRKLSAERQERARQRARQRERERIEKEERRLARERERARKRLGIESRP